MSGKDDLEREEGTEGRGAGRIWGRGHPGGRPAQSPGVCWRMAGAKIGTEGLRQRGCEGRREPAVSKRGGGPSGSQTRAPEGSRSPVPALSGSGSLGPSPDRWDVSWLFGSRALTWPLPTQVLPWRSGGPPGV